MMLVFDYEKMVQKLHTESISIKNDIARLSFIIDSFYANNTSHESM